MLFKTDSGTDLFVTGPLNRPKDGIAALTGIIETDWSPYTFTMNWPVSPGPAFGFASNRASRSVTSFRFARRARAVTPEMRKLSENPELEGEYKAWVG